MRWFITLIALCVVGCAAPTVLQQQEHDTRVQETAEKYAICRNAWTTIWWQGKPGLGRYDRRTGWALGLHQQLREMRDNNCYVIL